MTNENAKKLILMCTFEIQFRNPSRLASRRGEHALRSVWKYVSHKLVLDDANNIRRIYNSLFIAESASLIFSGFLSTSTSTDRMWAEKRWVVKHDNSADELMRRYICARKNGAHPRTLIIDWRSVRETLRAISGELTLRTVAELISCQLAAFELLYTSIFYTIHHFYTRH